MSAASTHAPARNTLDVERTPTAARREAAERAALATPPALIAGHLARGDGPRRMLLQQQQRQWVRTIPTAF